jgi:hypothetical protein
MDHDAGADVVSQLDRWCHDGDADIVPGLSRPPSSAVLPSPPEAAARSILTSIGFLVSEQQVLSPQGASSGMFSRRLAHIRLDLGARNERDAAAAVITHEAAHCLDRGPYDFDHPWSTTPVERLHALTAQLVACFSSHTFTRTVLGIDPGPGQLALARVVTRQVVDAGAMDQTVAPDVGRRVTDVTQTLQEALTAPPWTHRPDREVAVDRGRGVMWLAVGPASVGTDPPSAPAALAAELSRQAQRRFSDDPRFTEELDRSRPAGSTTD